MAMASREIALPEELPGSFEGSEGSEGSEGAGARDPGTSGADGQFPVDRAVLVDRAGHPATPGCRRPGQRRHRAAGRRPADRVSGEEGLLPAQPAVHADHGRGLGGSEADVPQAVAQLPWGHIRTLLDKTETGPERDWYAAGAVEHGWSRNVLMNIIMSQTKERTGSAASNFADLLPAPGPELVQQAAKDPYNSEFLGLSGEVAERDMEQRLTDRIVETLRGLGNPCTARLQKGEGTVPRLGDAGLFLSLGAFGAAPAVGGNAGALLGAGTEISLPEGHGLNGSCQLWSPSFPGFRQGKVATSSSEASTRSRSGAASPPGKTSSHSPSVAASFSERSHSG